MIVGGCSTCGTRPPVPWKGENMSLQGPKTAEWFGRASSALVNGVSSGFRYWGDDDTLVIDRGEGAYAFDMDGKRYIDYQLGFGPIILGHGHRPVVDAVSKAASRGTVFAMTTAVEVEAAEAMLKAIPWLDALRFTNTGTEATMHAIRLARAVTGRDLIVKFEGAYHGAHDYVAFSTAGSPVGNLGSRRSPVPYQVSSGIPSTIRDYIRIAPFNDLDFMERLFQRDGHRIADPSVRTGDDQFRRCRRGQRGAVTTRGHRQAAPQSKDRCKKEQTGRDQRLIGVRE